MKWRALTSMIICLLDVVHDILCPYFRDKEDKK
jgi:hypothetical protein